MNKKIPHTAERNADVCRYLNKIGCGKEIWDDSCKRNRNCGYMLGFPDHFLLCEQCQKKFDASQKCADNTPLSDEKQGKTRQENGDLNNLSSSAQSSPVFDLSKRKQISRQGEFGWFYEADLKELKKALMEELCLDNGFGICESSFGGKGDNLCRNCRKIENIFGEAFKDD